MRSLVFVAGVGVFVAAVLAAAVLGRLPWSAVVVGFGAALVAFAVITLLQRRGPG